MKARCGCGDRYSGSLNCKTCGTFIWSANSAACGCPPNWCAGGPTSTPDATRDLLAERSRQVAKGYTPEHDDEHPLGQLLGYGGLQWHPVTHSPEDRAKIRAEMIRAAACLLAGVEWIDRRTNADISPEVGGA